MYLTRQVILILLSMVFTNTLAVAEQPLLAPNSTPSKPYGDFLARCPDPIISVAFLFNRGVDLEPTSMNYGYIDPCKLWWWAEHAKSYHYDPLTEWAELLQEALIEKVPENELLGIVGFAPMPPLNRVQGQASALPQCISASIENQKKIREKLSKLNLNELSQDTIELFTKHCYAFEYQVPIWQRMSGQFVSIHLLPIGSVNFIIIGRRRLESGDNDSKPSSQTKEEETIDSNTLYYTTIATCPVDTLPQNCIDEYTSNLSPDTEIQPIADTSITMKATLYLRGLDSWLLNHMKTSRTIKMTVSNNGRLSFIETLDSMTPRDLRLTLYDGQIGLRSTEVRCKYGVSKSLPVVLHPLALGDRLEKLYKKISLYDSSDFPDSTTNESDIEEDVPGCGPFITIPQWMADTTNIVKHVGKHSGSIDLMYRLAAAERARRRVIGQSINQIPNNRHFDSLRTAAFEIPVPLGSSFEKQAIHFVLKAPRGSRNGEIGYRQIVIQDKPVTEVWYYYKPIPTSSDEEPNQLAHIFIKRLRSPIEAFSNLVLEPFTTLINSAQNQSEKKEKFIKAAYALFNTDPLQAGNAQVNTVVLAAIYENIFNKKTSLTNPTTLTLDASTLCETDFLKKYISDL